MRHSSKLGICILILALLVLTAVIDNQRRQKTYAANIWMRQTFQKTVGLTDLSITTAARYLRHYTLGDMTTPFQDYPASLDHFPAGFVYAPPDMSDFPNPVKFGPLPKLNTDQD